MELFFTIIVILILFCVIAGWLLYQQIEINKPSFKKGNFHTLELLLLREFIGMFDEALGRKLRLQLKYFRSRGKYWRIENSGCHRVELYEEEEDLMEEEWLFPLRRSSDLARIHFRIEDRDYTMLLRSYNGLVWGWDIRPNPGRKLHRSRFDLLDKTLLMHPEEIVSMPPGVTKNGNYAEKEFMSALLESPSLREVRSPKNLGRLQNRLRRSGTKLPEAFLSFLHYADGMIFENGKIYGSRALLRIMTRDEEFWPLAEFNGELLGVRPGDELGRVYLMNKKLRKLHPVKGDFCEHLLARLDTFNIRS